MSAVLPIQGGKQVIEVDQCWCCVTVESLTRLGWETREIPFSEVMEAFFGEIGDSEGSSISSHLRPGCSTGAPRATCSSFGCGVMHRWQFGTQPHLALEGVGESPPALNHPVPLAGAAARVNNVAADPVERVGEMLGAMDDP